MIEMSLFVQFYWMAGFFSKALKKVIFSKNYILTRILGIGWIWFN